MRLRLFQIPRILPDVIHHGGLQIERNSIARQDARKFNYLALWTQVNATFVAVTFFQLVLAIMQDIKFAGTGAPLVLTVFNQNRALAVNVQCRRTQTGAKKKFVRPFIMLFIGLSFWRVFQVIAQNPLNHTKCRRHSRSICGKTNQFLRPRAFIHSVPIHEQRSKHARDGGYNCMRNKRQH